MYSQTNEEKLVQEYFNGRKGTFLDLGANDGVTLSNTRALALAGWDGTLVEMLPVCIRKLSNTYRDRPDIQIIDKAIGPYDGFGPLYESGDHLGKGDHGLLSTIVKVETERWRNTKFSKFTEGQVEYLSIPTFFSMLQFDTYHFISIDIEGMDWDVLKKLDLTGFGCEFLCVEFNNKEPGKYIEYCRQFGLTEVARNPMNLMFAKC